MKILQVHNQYIRWGGEESVVQEERHLLEAHGHEVIPWVKHNAELEKAPAWAYPKLALDSIWSRRSYSEMVDRITQYQPDVVHVHNTVPQFSMSIFKAAHDRGVPALWTLHNYRMTCPGSYHFRDGQLCTDCLSSTTNWPAVRHGCYRDSHMQSVFSAFANTWHTAVRPIERYITRYIVLSEFARKHFETAGFTADKLVVKPNFIKAPDTPRSGEGDYFLFVGKLDVFKGVFDILEAWQELNGIPLKLVGTGVLAPEVAAYASPDIEILGSIERGRVLELMQGARALVFPSIWYEGFPMVLAETCALGIPAIACDFSVMAEIVDDGETGRLYPYGDVAGLQACVEALWHNPNEAYRLGQNALDKCRSLYTPVENYRQLMDIYDQAIVDRRKESRV